MRELTRLMCRGNCILSQWRRQDFATGGSEVWVYRGSRVRSPPVLVVLSVYQRGSSLDGLAMYLSCDTKKFHDNESTHILSLHNFWTSTHRGEASPLPSLWRRHCHVLWTTASAETRGIHRAEDVGRRKPPMHHCETVVLLKWQTSKKS